MTELMSFEDDAENTALCAEMLQEDRQYGYSETTVIDIERQMSEYQDPWPISGDHLTIKGLK